MTMVLNELARSMGQPDFYPFVMSKPVVAKVQFVQLVVHDTRSPRRREQRIAPVAGGPAIAREEVP